MAIIDTTRTEVPLEEQATSEPTATLLVDSDIHPVLLPPELVRRLPSPWDEHYTTFGTRVPGLSYPRLRNGGMRVDAWPEGGFPGSDLSLTRTQLLDEYGIDVGILIPLASHAWGAEARGFAGALCATGNDWIAEEWLDREPRLRATIDIPFEHPDLAVREIERRAGDPRFVQVLVSGNGEAQMGDAKYWPIYEAAAASGLPIACHVGGYESHHSGAGWPSYYIEDHLWLHSTVAQLTVSFISEGVFERFPSLQVVLVEGGITWAGPLMWAMDAAFARIGGELAHLQRKPSEYFRDHFWFTTQPIEEPDDPRQLVEALGFIDMPERILFASDYPHWDFDAPSRALPRVIAGDARDRIMGRNAARLYDLGRSQPPG